MTTEGSGSQQGWGSGGEAAGSAHFSAYWGLGVGEPQQLHLLPPPKKIFFSEELIPNFKKPSLLHSSPRPEMVTCTQVAEITQVKGMDGSPSS